MTLTSNHLFGRLRAVICALSLLLAATTLTASAQERNQMPEGREAEALRQAYANLMSGKFSVAAADYKNIEDRYRNTAAEPVARRGALVAEILIWSQDIAQEEGPAATMARLRSQTLPNSILELQEEGVIGEEEAAYWQAFMDTNADIAALAATPDFAFLSPDAFSAAVLATAQR